MGVENSDVRWVGKTDDNVVLDLARLLDSLATFPPSPERFFACGTPVRNTRWIRPSGGQITGVWSVARDTVEEDRVPDWCVGWLYVTTPGVGAAIVQAGQIMFPHTEVNFPEDHLITGLLRHSLRDVSITSYETGLPSSVFLHFLSHCPVLTGLKTTFFGQIVLEKTSSRSERRLKYCGSPLDWEVWTFYLCFHYELWLSQADNILGGVLPSLAWGLCQR